MATGGEACELKTQELGQRQYPHAKIRHESKLRVMERKLSRDRVSIDRQQSYRWKARSRVLALRYDHPQQLGNNVTVTCDQNPGRPIFFNEGWH